jgi:hypothetical protein
VQSAQIRNSHRQLINGPGPADYTWYDIDMNAASPTFLKFKPVGAGSPTLSAFPELLAAINA